MDTEIDGAKMGTLKKESLRYKWTTIAAGRRID